MHGIPGMYTPEHIRGWKAVTDAVHAKGAYMACQLWHVSHYTAPSQFKFAIDAKPVVRTFCSLSPTRRPPATELISHEYWGGECIHSQRTGSD